MQLTLTQWRKTNNVPTNKLLKQKVSEYIQNRDWYINSINKIKELYPDDYKLFASILAVTSQQNSINVNVDFTNNTFIAIKNNNSLLAFNYGIAHPSVLSNLYKVIKGQLPNGNKIRPFNLALLGDLNQIVIDSHMVKLFNLPRKTPNKTDIKHISTIINNLASELNLKPCEIQSCLWVYIKTELPNVTNREIQDYSYYLSKKELI